MEVLKQVYDDVMSLSRSFLPFIENGGIFIPTEKPLAMGCEVMLELTLPGKEPVSIKSKVVWYAASSVKNEKHTPGMGLQFQGNQAQVLQQEIEAMIADSNDDTNKLDIFNT